MCVSSGCYGSCNGNNDGGGWVVVAVVIVIVVVITSGGRSRGLSGLINCPLIACYIYLLRYLSRFNVACLLA